MAEIDSDERYTEVLSRIRAFHTKKHPVHIMIGDKRFEYVPKSD